MTSYTQELIDSLTTLNKIADTLNRTVDIQDALDSALSLLVDLMGLETGWIFLKDPAAKNQWAGKGFVLASHHNLPPAMALHKASAWKGGCDCQAFCTKGTLKEGYNEIRCTRLAETKREDREGLVVHASAPLRSGDETLGILNVAAPDWSDFTPEALALLTNVGSQMGIALERARLFDMLKEQRIDEQAALLQLSDQLLSRPALEELMPYLVSEARELLHVDACALVMPCEQPGLVAFRAASGWRHDPASLGRRIPQEMLFGLEQVMETQRPVLVEDIERISLPTPLPDWLQSERFRGHSVVPLIVEGRTIGTLMINSRRTRLLEEDELRFLQLMANQAAMAIENARLHDEELQRQRLEEELALGKQIQLSMLPATRPEIPGWEFITVYQAARLVGGDFYDHFQLPGRPQRLGIVVADVAGKGVPAALFMALSRTVIRTTALSGRNPASALMRANHLILTDSQTDLFLSIFYAALEIDTGRMIFANAGHNRPLWIQAASGRVEELSSQGIVLGAFPDIELEERRIDLAPDDIVVFYTDGITEALNDAGEMFGEARLRQVLADSADGDAQQVVRAIVDAYNAFTGDTEQTDDVTFLVVKRLRGQSAAAGRNSAPAG